MLRGKCALCWDGVRRHLVIAGGLALALGGAVWAMNHSLHAARHSSYDPQFDQGRDIFRYDTFGDERQWTDTLRMHEVIQRSLDPLTALGLGLKVDVEALPDSVLEAILAGQVDLTDPATTLTLLEHDAVVGVVGKVEQGKNGRTLVSVGITCALCHSTVDDSLMPGIGRRLDGWANHELNPGAIIALSPAIPDEKKAVYNSWGPGMYDPRFSIDGLSTPIVIPPAYGLHGVAKETYTGDGDVSYWNNYVAVTQMGGQGVFIDPRLNLRVVRHPDLVHSKLKPLLEYQLSLAAPPPPPGSFDPDLAAEGAWVFNTIGRCVECHSSPQYTDINDGILHDADEIGQDGAYAARTATGQYRTTPLRGLWQHAPYFHDGSAATLEDVVKHYDTQFDLKLEDRDKAALVEFLKTL